MTFCRMSKKLKNEGRQIPSRFLLWNLYKKNVSGLGPTSGRFQRSGKGRDSGPDSVYCHESPAYTVSMR